VATVGPGLLRRMGHPTDVGRRSKAYPFGAFNGALDTGTVLAVLGLTFAERKALGVRENTFHDIKKRAGGGKPLRLYGKVARRLPAIPAELLSC
jgi:hypothetical protein